ncbi:MAG TPA: nicotinate-nucleotide adenylyltransferase [Planctomycetes bacterium]|nr:nicotinate-nucleotide adenylyltransferase [Planctomycetota bacterium]
MRRIGVLGGTFDPVHNGHLHVAQQVREKLGIDEIILVPTGAPPHKAGRRLADAHHRYAMALIAVHNLRALSVSDVEVRRAGLSYTIDTVELLRQRFGGARIFFIIGADAAAELNTWREAEKLLSQVTPVVVARPGYSRELAVTGLEGGLSPAALDRLLEGFLEIETVDVSSTDIRERFAAGRSVRGLLRREVEEYIRRHGLYGARALKRG